jgi:hypothetical protein
MLVLFVAVRARLFTAEPMVILGPEAIGSLKVTVTVILSPGLMVLSGSFVVMLTVGVEVSTLKVILCVPAT